MKKIILTGLEEKYVENECPENIIYLGAWANIPESYHELLENIKKYKFRDLECSDNSELIEYCISVANSLLPIISRRMNKDLCLSHDIEFWDLVLSFWILLTVFVLFDRFVRIKIFVDKYKNEKCLIWLASGFAPSPHKGENLMEYYLDPAINHHIMSSIIGGMDVPNWTIKYIDVKRGYCNNDFIHCATPLVKIIFRKVKKYLLNVSNSILPKFGYYDTSYGPNYKDIILLKLISLFLNLKNTGNSINNRETKCDNYVRSLSDDFGLYVKKNIMGFLPTSYTEDFKKTYNHGEILFNKIKKYKYIVVDPFHSGEEEKKISYALYKKNGGR